MPFYPAPGLSARIQGKVALRFTVDEQGKTTEVEAISGHELLRRPTVENVQNWKFGWPHPCACRVKREAVFVYILSDELGTAGEPDVVVKWFTKTQVIRIEVEADGVEINPESAH